MAGATISILANAAITAAGNLAGLVLPKVSAWTAAAIGGGLGALQYLLRERRPDVSTSTDASVDRVQTFASGPARWVLGRAKVGGVVAFWGERHDVDLSAAPRDDTKADDLHLAIMVSEGACDIVEAVIVGNDYMPVVFQSKDDPNLPARDGTKAAYWNRSLTDNSLSLMPQIDGAWWDASALITIRGAPYRSGYKTAGKQRGAWRRSTIDKPYDPAGEILGRHLWPNNPPDRNFDDEDWLERMDEHDETIRKSELANAVGVWPHLDADGSTTTELHNLFRTAEPPWGDEHKLEGISWIHVRLRQPSTTIFDDKVFRSGVPRIQFVVRGLKIGWPGASAPTWTENAAAIRWWWHTERRGIPSSAIDRDDFDRALAICNEESKLPIPPDDGDRPDWATEADPENLLTFRKYTVNGVLSSGDDPPKVEEEFDDAWQGFVVEEGGVLHYLPGAPRAVEPLPILSRDIVDLISFKPAPALSERINAVTLTLNQSRMHEFESHSLREIVDETKRGSSVPGEDAGIDQGIHLPRNLGTWRWTNHPATGWMLSNIALRRARNLSTWTLRLMPGRSDDIVVSKHALNLRGGTDSDSFTVGLAHTPLSETVIEIVPDETLTPLVSLSSRSITTSTTDRVTITVSAFTGTDDIEGEIVLKADGLESTTIKIDADFDGSLDDLVYDPATEWIDMSPGRIYRLRIPEERVDERVVLLEKSINDDLTVDVVVQAQAVDAFDIAFELPDIIRRPPSLPPPGTRPIVPGHVLGAAVHPTTFSTDDGAIVHRFFVIWTPSQFSTGLVFSEDEPGGETIERTTTDGSSFVFEVDRPAPEYRIELWHFDGAGRRGTSSYLSVAPDWTNAGAALPPPTWLKVITYGASARLIFSPIENSRLSGLVSGVEVRYRRKDIDSTDPFLSVDDSEWDTLHLLETEPIQIVRGLRMTIAATFDRSGRYSLFARHVTRIASPIAPVLRGPISASREILIRIPERSVISGEEAPAWSSTNARHLARFVERSVDAPARGQSLLMIDRGTTAIRRDDWNGYDSDDVERAWPFGRCEGYGLAFGSTTIPHSTGTGLPDPRSGSGTWYLTDAIDVGTARRVEVRADVYSFAPESDIQSDLSFPIASTIDDQDWRRGTAVLLVLPAATNAPAGAAVSYALTGLPVGLTFTVSTRRVTGTPTVISSGEATYTASDDAGGSVSLTFDWSVAGTVSAPAAISAPAITVTHNSATVTWAAAARASQYDIQYRAGSGAWTPSTPTRLTSRTRTFTGLSSNTVHSVRIRGVNSGATGAWTTRSFTTSVAPTAPGVPTGLALVGGTTTIAAAWTSEPKAVTYEIRWKLSSAGSYPAGNLRTGIESNAFTITGLSSSTGHDVQVRARNDVGASGWSASVSRTTGTDTLTTPVVSVNGNSSSGIVFVFTAVSGATSYEVAVRETPDAPGNSFTSGSFTTIAANSSTTKTVEGTVEGYRYDYRLRYFVNGRTSPTKTGFVIRGGVPLPPVVSVGTTTSSTIPISWPSVSGATHYGIQYRLGSSGAWTSVVETTSTSFTITNLSSSRSYQIRVRSKNAQGFSRNPDAGFSTGTTKAPTITLGMITGVAATAADHDTIRVSWNSTTGATSYTVIWSSSGGSGTVGNYPAGTTRADWNGALPSTTYTIRVMARRGSSSSSASVSVTTPASPTKPYSMSSPTLTAASTTIEVDFRARAGSWMTRFDIRYRRKGSSSWTTTTLAVSVSSTRFYDFERVITGLTADRTYQVQVRGVVGTATTEYSVGNGNWTSTSEVSTKLSKPAKVTGIYRTARTTNSISISWPAVPNTTDYELRIAPRTGNFITSFAWYFRDTSLDLTYNVTPGTYHRAQLRARNDAGSGPWSDVFFDRSDWLDLGTMGSLKAAASGSNTRLTWSAVPNATGYEIRRGSSIVAAHNTSTSYTQSGIPSAGSSWTFTIRAVQRQIRWTTPTQQGATVTVKSNAQTTTFESPLTPPVASPPVVSNITSTTFSVRWRIPSTATEGQLQVRLYSSGAVVHSVPDPTDPEHAIYGYSVSGLKPGTRYEVRVRWRGNGTAWGSWASTPNIWMRASGSVGTTEGVTIAVSSDDGVYRANVGWDEPTGFLEGNTYEIDLDYRERGDDWTGATTDGTTSTTASVVIPRIPPIDVRARVRVLADDPITDWTDFHRIAFYDESAPLTIGQDFLNESSLPSGYSAGASSRTNAVPLQGFGETASTNFVDFTGRLFASGAGVQIHFRWEPASSRQAFPITLSTKGLSTSMYFMDSEGRILYSGRSMSVDFEARQVFYIRILFDGLEASSSASDGQRFRLRIGEASDDDGGAVGLTTIEDEPVDPVDPTAMPPVFAGEIDDFVVEEGVAMTGIDLPVVAGGTPPYSMQAFGLPAGLVLTDGRLTGTPTDTAPMMGTVEFIAKDAAGGFDQRIVRWTVAMDIPIGGFSGIGRIDNPFQIPCALVDNIRQFLLYPGATNAAAIEAAGTGARTACTWFRCPTTSAHRALIRGAAAPDLDLVVKVGSVFLTSETTDDVEWVDAPGSSDGAVIGVFRYASTTTSTGSNNTGSPVILEWSPETIAIPDEASGVGGATNRKQAGPLEAGGTVAPPGETVTDIHVYHRGSDTGAWSRNPTTLSAGSWAEAHPSGGNVKQVRFLAHFRRWSNRAVRRFSHFIRDRA